MTSYSYIWEDDALSVEELARVSGDPYRIDQMPHVAKLRVSVERDKAIKTTPLEVYLSRTPLTDKNGKLLMQWGAVREDVFDGVLMFPELSAGEEEFTFTYLHPGSYFLTVVADVNGDGFASKGDLTHASIKLDVVPKKTTTVQVESIKVKN